MAGKLLILLCVLGFFGQTVVAQTTLTATRLAAATSTSARFSMGLTMNNGSSYLTTATTNDAIRIIGSIEPEAAQVDQTADIYVVAKLGANYFMRNAAGSFVYWSGSVADLVAYKREKLAAKHSVEFLSGNIPVTGTFLLFLGYKTADGVLTYTSTPHVIGISAPMAVADPNMDYANPY